MSNIIKINFDQKEILGNFMEQHTDLAKGILTNSAQGRARSNQLWEHLAGKLNAAGPPKKDAKLWRKVYADQKQNARKKVNFNKHSKKRTGGGPYEEKVLSHVEEQIVAAAGIEVGVHGLKTIQSFGSAKKQKPAEDLSSSDDDRPSTSKQKYDDRASTSQQNYDDRASTSQQKYDDRASTSQQKYDDCASKSQQKYDDRASTSQQKYDGRASTSQQKYDERASTSQKKVDNFSTTSPGIISWNEEEELSFLVNSEDEETSVPNKSIEVLPRSREVLPRRKEVLPRSKEEKESKITLLKKNIMSTEDYQKEMLKRYDKLCEIKTKNHKIKEEKLQLMNQIFEIKKKTLIMKEREQAINMQIKEMDLQIRKKELEKLNMDIEMQQDF